MDPTWCGPKKFRPPHPKKVVFGGGAECSAKTMFSSFFRQKSAFRGAWHTYRVRSWGYPQEKCFLELSVPQLVRSKKFSITPPPQKVVLGSAECSAKTAFSAYLEFSCVFRHFSAWKKPWLKLLLMIMEPLWGLWVTQITFWNPYRPNTTCCMPYLMVLEVSNFGSKSRELDHFRQHRLGQRGSRYTPWKW